jgi:hypothetical protein
MSRYFIPFSFSDRGCIGRNISYLEQTIFFATILRRYEFAFKRPDWEIKKVEGLNIWPQEFPLKIWRRERPLIHWHWIFFTYPVVRLNQFVGANSICLSQSSQVEETHKMYRIQDQAIPSF